MADSAPLPGTRSVGPDRWLPRATGGEARALVVPGVLAVVALLAIGRYAFVCDAAYADLATTRAAAGGWSAGVEAAGAGGSLLWAEAALEIGRMGFDPGWAPSAVGVLAGLTLLVLVRRSLSELGIAAPVASLATALLAITPTFAAWSTGGLPIMLAALASLTLLRGLVLGRRVWPAAASSALLPWCMPWGGAWTALLVALGTAGRLARVSAVDRALPRSVRRPLTRELTATAVAAAALTASVWGGGWSTAAATATNGSLSPFDVVRGAKYVAGFVVNSWTPLFALVGLPYAWRQRSGGLAPAIGAAAIGSVVFATALGGDDLPLGRLLVPALPFGAALIALGADVVRQRYGVGWAATLLGLLLVVTVLPSGGVVLAPRPLRVFLHHRADTSRSRSELQEWEHDATFVPRNLAVGRAMASVAAPGEGWLSRTRTGARAWGSSLALTDAGPPPRGGGLGVRSRVLARTDAEWALGEVVPDRAAAIELLRVWDVPRRSQRLWSPLLHPLADGRILVTLHRTEGAAERWQALRASAREDAR